MALPELPIILEALLLAAGEPLSLDRLLDTFPEAERPERETLRAALVKLAASYAGRGMALVEVAGGFRLQVPKAFAPWVSRLSEERAAHYSRALLETLALIAYRQPITRGEIEEVDWIKIIGHREVPGRPALYATTRVFLDYFNLKNLGDLPPLAAPRDLAAIGAALEDRTDPPAASSADSSPQTEFPDV